MASASLEDAKIIAYKLGVSAYGIAHATTTAAASAVQLAANHVKPAVAAAYRYSKPAITAACSTIAKNVSDAPGIVTGVASAFVVAGAVNMLTKRRRISSSTGSGEPNSNGVVDQTDPAWLKKQIQEEVKRQLDAARLMLPKQLETAKVTSEVQQSSPGSVHESGHKRCRDGSIKNDTDTDTSLKTALNIGRTKITEDAQTLTKQNSLPVVDNAEQRSASIGNKDSNVQETDEEIVQPAGVQDGDETKSQSKASLAMLEEEKVLKNRERLERDLMSAMLQNNSANAPTPDAENALGGTLRKSSSEYSNQSEESSSEQELGSSEGEEEEKRLTPVDDIQCQTTVSESDYGEKDTDAMDKNSPEPTDTQIQSELESSQRPDEETHFSHNSKKSFSQPKKSNDQIIDLSC